MNPTAVRALLVLMMLSLVAALTVSAADVVQIRTNFYPVKGETARELRRSLELSRPKGQTGAHNAVTDWQIEWKSDVARKDGVCQLSFFDTKTVVTITLPSWMPATNATPELKRLWKNYYTALLTHESEHARMALGVAAEIQARAREVAPRPNCDEYKRLITEQARAVVRDVERRQKEYDEQTRHGATQGAVWRSGGPIRR